MKEHRQQIKFGVSMEKRILPENHLVSSLPPHQWKEMTLTDLPTNLVLQNQGSASDCGANGPKKMINLQTKGELIVSCHPYYARRNNNPELGMSLDDILNIPCISGTCLESEDPSDGLSEEQLNAPVTIKTSLVGSSSIELDPTNVEELASHYDAFGGLILTVNIAWDEWDNEQGIPVYIPDAQLAGGHCLGGGIPALYNGSKGFFFQNSWGNDDDSINETSWVFFTETFLRNRGTGAGTFNAPSMAVNYQDLFSSTLHLGSQGTDVIKLQTILGIKSDGIFGPKTEAEVMLFQTLHDLVPDGIVGLKTQTVLQTLIKPEYKNIMPTIQTSTTSLIAGFEVFSATPYLDQGNKWTIGYGTIEINGIPVTENTPAITEQEAENIMSTQLIEYAQAVTNSIHVELNQNQFDACCSLCYNIGTGGFTNSTVVRDCNSNNFSGAADSFLLWDKVDGQVNQDLVDRRKIERDLFLKSIS